jgi:hypothetical protein
VERFEPIAANYADEWPAWMHRKIAAVTRADGYAVSSRCTRPSAMNTQPAYTGCNQQKTAL